MKKNKVSQLIAAIALFAIVIWIIGTWILVLTAGSNTQNIELSQEELQQIINSQSGVVLEDTPPVETEENTQEETPQSEY